MNLVLPFPRFRLPFHRTAELRIDVDPSRTGAYESLDRIYNRIRTPGDRLHELPSFALPYPHLRIRVSEADGELYAYVEDLQRGCLARCTVFNRLVEVNREADRHLRSPHSRYLAHYQRRGIATAVYEWALGTGVCLITGARQSPGAHALWLTLARKHVAGFADLRNKKLIYLRRDVMPKDLDRIDTRMFLIGREWTLPNFLEAVGMHFGRYKAKSSHQTSSTYHPAAKPRPSALHDSTW